MQTQYPLDGKIELAINPQKETTFGFEIRIPSWAGRNFRILVNGEQQRYFHKGSYLSLYRKWMKGDRITIDFDLETRVVHHEHSQAVTHGPLVFARDSRFNDGDVDECAVIQCDREGVVQATLKNTFESSFAWITMEVPMILGTDLENPGNKAVRMIHFCDFAHLAMTGQLQDVIGYGFLKHFMLCPNLFTNIRSCQTRKKKVAIRYSVVGMQTLKR